MQAALAKQPRGRLDDDFRGRSACLRETRGMGGLQNSNGTSDRVLSNAITARPVLLLHFRQINENVFKAHRQLRVKALDDGFTALCHREQARSYRASSLLDFSHLAPPFLT
jgi:hypothetical protein